MSDRSVKGTLDLDTDPTRKALAKAAEAYRDLADQAERQGRDATEAIAEQEQAAAGLRGEVGRLGEEWGGMATAAAGAGALWAASAVDSRAQATGRLSAQVGGLKGDMSDLDDVARSVWTNNFGESIPQVGDLVAGLRQQLGPIADEDLQSITETTLAAQDAFANWGFDADQVAVAMGQVKKNYPDSNDEQTLEQIVGMYQRHGPAAEDLLDTLIEYPGQFAEMNLSADDMFAVLDAGLESGIRNTDFMADSVKELGNTLLDAESEARPLLDDLLGPDRAREMIAGFEDGTTSASDMFTTIIEELAQVNDKTERNALLTGIMGTKAEDIRPQVENLAAALGQQRDTATESAESVGALNDQYDNQRSKIEGLVRRIQDGVVGEMAEVSGGLLEVGGSVGMVVGGLDTLGVDLGDITGKVRNFKWGALAKGGAIAAGLAAVPLVLNEITDWTDVDVDAGLLTEGLEQYIEVGNSAQLDSAIGNTQALGEHLREHFFADIKFGQAREMPALIGELDSALSGMVEGGRLDAASQAFALFDDAMTDAGVPVEHLVAEMPQMRDALAAADLTVQDLRGGIDLHGRALSAMADYTVDAADVQPDLAGGLEDVNEAAEETLGTVDDLTGALRDHATGVTSVTEAEADWEAAIDDASASLKDNGANLDLSTEKGRANHDALIGMRNAALDHRDAVLEQTGSVDQANATLDTARDRLYDAAVAAGASEEEARELTSSLHAIPDDVETAYDLDSASSENALDRLHNKLDDLPRYITTTHTTFERVEAVGGGYSSGSGGRVVRAEGGPVGPGYGGGWAMVGEQGPEVVKFDTPGHVYTADETGRIVDAISEMSPSGGDGAALDYGRMADAVKGAMAGMTWVFDTPNGRTEVSMQQASKYGS